MRKVAIIPTGNEIACGIVVDSDSPAILDRILEHFPACEFTRMPPCVDRLDTIIAAIMRCVHQAYSHIILIGGSGEGHCHQPEMSRDETHAAMIKVLDYYEKCDVFGPNGHRWCRIVAGRCGGALLFNVPGPYVEAVAAIEAALAILTGGNVSFRDLADACATAVCKHYPQASFCDE
ncbi:MAG: molybdopterin-binding protein [Chitinivibrionales bacterium]|nr:molybdopterin-binding protein [Chitinivibrionales bacterium]